MCVFLNTVRVFTDHHIDTSPLPTQGGFGFL